MNAIGTASGLAISVGIIGVAVYTGAAGATDQPTSSTESCTSSSSTAAPESSVTTTTEPTAPTTTASEETSTSAPEPSTPTSTPDTCSNPPATDDPTTTTTTPNVVQPRGTTQPPAESESGGGSVDKTLTPTATEEALASGGDGGRSGSSGGGIGGSASGLPGPHADQVPRPGEVPGGSLPNQNVPVLGTHVPDFGMLGPDPKSLTAASMSSGDAEALPSPQPALGNAELLAVSALAMVVGLLARTLAVRPLRVRIRRNDGDI